MPDNNQLAHWHHLAQQSGRGNKMFSRPIRFKDADTGEVIMSNEDAFKPQPFFFARMSEEEKKKWEKNSKKCGCPKCGSRVTFNERTISTQCGSCHEYLGEKDLNRIRRAIKKMEDEMKSQSQKKKGKK